MIALAFALAAGTVPAAADESAAAAPPANDSPSANDSPANDSPSANDSSADEPAAADDSTTADGSAAAAPPAADKSAAAADEPAASSQEIGAALGVEAGGRLSPGGFHVLGDYLYQLSDQDWFDSGLSITIGGGDAGCFRDRDNDFLCDHGITRGFAAEGFAGARRFFAGQGAFAPYARAALGARIVSFRGDDVTGFALPIQLGGGIRARVADGIAVVAGTELRLGIGWFDHELGAEPQISLAIHAGVEFAL